MARNKVIGWILLGVVLLVALSGYGMWRIMQQPMYRPGALAGMDMNDPVGTSMEPGSDAVSAVSSGRWEVEPGVELAFFSVGNGENVLVVHGGPGLPQTASAPAFDALANAYRFHYYAQRGSGESFRPAFDFSGSRWANIQLLEGALGIGQQLADIERIRRLLGEDRLLLVGHSYGAFLASLYAADMPDRVRGLVLIAPANLMVFPSPRGGLFDTLRDRLPADERPAYDAWVAEYFDLGGIFARTETELAALDAKLGPYFEAAGGNAPAAVSTPANFMGVWHARAQYFSMGRRHDFSNALGAITAPTLIVHGGNDFQPVEVAEDYTEWIAGSEVVTIQDTGHFPHYSHGEELAPLVRRFLDERTTR